jgi:hypothetical protein
MHHSRKLAFIRGFFAGFFDHGQEVHATARRIRQSLSLLRHRPRVSGAKTLQAAHPTHAEPHFNRLSRFHSFSRDIRSLSFPIASLVGTSLRSLH